MDRKVNLFVVGQPRTGTTALYEYFKAHPDIFVSDQKQLYHFEKDYNQYRYENIKSKNIVNSYYNYTLDDYKKHFTKVLDQKIIADITPSYLYSDVAAKEIYKYNPHAKIVALFREPVSYISSIHNLLVVNHIEKITKLKDAVNSENLRFENHFKQSLDEKKEILHYSKRVDYKKQLKRFFDLFGENKVHIVIYEDYKKNNEKVLNEIYKFLNINQPRCHKPIININSSKTERFPILTKFIKTKWLSYLSFSLPSFVRSYIGKKIKFLISKNDKIELNQALRIKLMAKYQPYVFDFCDYLESNKKISKKNNLISLWGYNKI